jgi:hypothetical protein
VSYSADYAAFFSLAAMHGQMVIEIITITRRTWNTLTTMTGNTGIQSYPSINKAMENTHT